MRILVYPHDLAMGGSQLNAIDLAATMQDRGHEVAVFGRDDTLVTRIEDLGLEFIGSPQPRRRPTPSVVASLRQVVSQRGADVVHGYEWPPTLEALLACQGTRAVAVSTVLSMSVAPFIPHHVPLMVGTEQIMAVEQAAGRAHVKLMEPPIDTRLNSPDVRLPVQAFTRDWGIDGDAFTVVVVSRLAQEMKLEGILTTIETVRRLGPDRTVQLLVVGGGPAEPTVRRHAERANAQLGRNAVVMTGEMLDPRPAYAVADVALGMGSSALRAMAFGKPLIVQGIDGFWEPLIPETLETFLWQGWYGQGPGTEGTVDRLGRILARLMDEPRLREDMGRLALQTVRHRFSLAVATDRQLAVYERALAAKRDGHSQAGAWKDNAASLARFVRHTAGQAVDRWRGHQAAEDFNSQATLAFSSQRQAGVGMPAEGASAAEMTRS
jgi:L-malate glycosyltransferase